MSDDYSNTISFYKWVFLMAGHNYQFYLKLAGDKKHLFIKENIYSSLKG